MKEYEVVYTYLNGCAGSAYPQTSFEEIEVADADTYIREKFGKDFAQFTKEIRPNGQIVFTFDNGTVSHTYEFTEL